MKVLIAGGYGFIGSFVAERFHKEGHQVFILDNESSGSRQTISFKHKNYCMSIDDPQCEQIFKLNKFDVVIHLAGSHHTKGASDLSDSTKDEVQGLVHLLTLSERYKVKQFVFASSTDVYEDGVAVLEEQSPCNPKSLQGLHKRVGEQYCDRWSSHHQLPTLVFRLSHVYGPVKSNAIVPSGLNGLLFQLAMGNKHVTVADPSANDYIYVEDVADAMYRSVEYGLQGIFNLSSGTTVQVERLADFFTTQGVTLSITNHQDSPSQDTVINNRKIKRELDWAPIYTVEEGMEKTLARYKVQHDKLVVHTASDLVLQASNHNWGKESKWVTILKSYLPLLEIAVFFTIMYVLNLLIGNEYETLDMTLLFIIFAIIFLGKTHSTFILVLGISWYIYEELSMGREVVSLLSNISFLSTISVYLLVGMTLGYMIDRKDKKLIEIKGQLESQIGKYEFLYHIFEETRTVKEELQERIIYSEDSFNKISGIVSKLDTLEPQEIFSSSIKVVEEIMKTEEVAIYTVNDDQTFMRLAARSLKIDAGVPSFIRTQEDPALQQVLTSKKTVVNKHFHENAPVLLAPILNGDTITAILCIYNTEFEKLTLHYQNLFTTLAGLITSAIIRANEYVFATNHERYVKGTKVLQPRYFERILQNKQSQKEDHGMGFTVIEIKQPQNQTELNQLLEVLQTSIRESDFIGFTTQGTLNVILSNTEKWDAEIAIHRLKAKNIPVVEETLLNA